MQGTLASSHGIAELYHNKIPYQYAAGLLAHHSWSSLDITGLLDIYCCDFIVVFMLLVGTLMCLAFMLKTGVLTIVHASNRCSSTAGVFVIFVFTLDTNLYKDDPKISTSPGWPNTPVALSAPHTFCNCPFIMLAREYLTEMFFFFFPFMLLNPVWKLMTVR